MIIRLLSIILFITVWSSCGDMNLKEHAGSLTYYVDSENGLDDNDGTSKQKPWKTLENLNNCVFSPGDSILFKRGSVFSGYLKLHGSGNRDSIIVLSTYGEGKRPIINAANQSQEAILLQNASYWSINDLEITNQEQVRKAFRYGIRLMCRDFEVMSHIRLNNLYVHDVNGSIISHNGEGAGIFYENRGRLTTSKFDSLIIENCRVENTDRDGIFGFSSYTSRRSWCPNENVIIRNNHITNVAGDGIKIQGCDGAILEYNVISKGKMRCKDFAAGINIIACDNSYIQYNEISEMQGAINGRAFCSGSNCKNNIFQYNYSHDNLGGFAFIKSEPISFDNIGSQNTVFRYNISQKDNSEIIHFYGPIQHSQIYNNTIYITDNSRNDLLISTANNGWGNNIEVFNNIFHSVYGSNITHNTKIKDNSGKFIKAAGLGSVSLSINSNLFSGDFYNIPNKDKQLYENALLDSIGSGKQGLNSLSGYKINKESPAINAGINLNDSTLIDFWQVRVPQDSLTDIGASEFNF